MNDHEHDRHENRHEHEEIRLLRDIRHSLRHIEQLLAPPPTVFITSFVVTQGDTPMPTQGPLLGIAPGLSDVFTATPVDASGNAVSLPSGVSAVVTSDDPTDAITLTTPDGLSFSVSVAPTATPGAFHTLTVALPDGSASSPNSLPILGTAPTPVAGFVVTQGVAAP